MKKLLFTGLTLAVLTSCETKKSTASESTTSESTTSGSVTASDSQPQCYALMTKGDTVRLSLTQTGNDVTGDLLYQLSGKDRNTGMIHGTMHGDTLLANYNFQSEGVESVREVAFLAKEGGFVEGYGPVQEQKGKMVFTPNTSLTFSSNRVLTKITCFN
jgi:hypothetical protein